MRPTRPTHLDFAFLNLDRDEAALDAFERVLKVDPQSASAKINVEIVKQRIKDKSI